MSDVVKVGKVDSAMMKAVAANDTHVTYSHTAIEATTYACTGCGLVWTRKWHAETCEERKHVVSFPQHYGWKMNRYGTYAPTQTFVRKAIARNKSLIRTKGDELAKSLVFEDLLTGVIVQGTT